MATCEGKTAVGEPCKRTATANGFCPAHGGVAAEKKVVEKKSLESYSPTGGALWAVKWKGGGQLPDALDGLWTSKALANEAINVHECRDNQ